MYKILLIVCASFFAIAQAAEFNRPVKKAGERGVVSQLISDLAKADLPKPIRKAAASAAGGPTGLVVKAETTEDKKKKRALMAQAAQMDISRRSESKKRAARETLEQAKASIDLSITQIAGFKEQQIIKQEARDGSARHIGQEEMASRKHFKSSLKKAIRAYKEVLRADDPQLNEEVLNVLCYEQFKGYERAYCQRIQESFDLQGFINSLERTYIPIQKNESPRKKEDEKGKEKTDDTEINAADLDAALARLSMDS